MKCANVAFSVVTRTGDGDAENWSSVLAYVWHRMLFSFIRIYLQHIARPVESDRPINIVFVRLSILP